MIQVTRHNGGARIEGTSDVANFVFIVDAAGRLTTYQCVVKQEIPNDFNPETERAAAKQGGCCGTPAE